MGYKGLSLDDVKIKRESYRIWLGVFLALFGCTMILVGAVMPPIGVIHGSILTGVGEVFGLAGASLGFFSYNKRDSSKLDVVYNFVEDEKRQRNLNIGDSVDSQRDV